MQYRTNGQFNTVVENCINGNWSDAMQNCVDYGFYSNDLIKMHEEASRDGLLYFDEYDDCDKVCMGFEDPTDIAIVIEGATKLRYK